LQRVVASPDAIKTAIETDDTAKIRLKTLDVLLNFPIFSTQILMIQISGYFDITGYTTGVLIEMFEEFFDGVPVKKHIGIGEEEKIRFRLASRHNLRLVLSTILRIMKNGTVTGPMLLEKFPRVIGRIIIDEGTMQIGKINICGILHLLFDESFLILKTDDVLNGKAADI
jgi:hypothetical protein